MDGIEWCIDHNVEMADCKICRPDLKKFDITYTDITGKKSIVGYGMAMGDEMMLKLTHDDINNMINSKRLNGFSIEEEK